MIFTAHCTLRNKSSPRLVGVSFGTQVGVEGRSAGIFGVIGCGERKPSRCHFCCDAEALMGIAIWAARSEPSRFASREDAVDETVRSDAGD